MRDGYGFLNSRWGGDKVSPGFMGVKFQIGADTHYGFVEVSIPAPYTVDGGGWPGSGTNSPVVGAYGYESVANANVHAAVPEPSSLGLLALGAGELAMLRRRGRKQSCNQGKHLLN
ncbi:MAG: hypothetical protein ACI9R3_005047 [Verrucomicrobiales bacterium]